MTAPAHPPGPAAAPAIEVRELVRVFTSRKRPPVRALDGVDLRVPAGEVHGLLGPNGAGKTTLVKILTTVLLPTSGRARVCGHDVVTRARRVRTLIGIVFGGERGLYGRLTGRENLTYWAALYRLPSREIGPRTATLLDRVGLADRADDRVETYSRGMKQRLHLARGLVSGARVLFLDEPTAGMDPVAAREFRELVGALRADGCTVLLATHDMAEAEALCDRVTLVDRGQVIATESPDRLGRLISRFRWVDIHGASPVVLDEVGVVPGVTAVERHPPAARAHLDRDDAVAAVLRLLLDRGVTDVKVATPSLEEVYLGIIGDRTLTR